MYCPTCREPRLTAARGCAICGAALVERSREEFEVELSHIRYVLAEAALWDPAPDAQRARRFLGEKLGRRERLLSAAITGNAPPAPEPIVDALPVAAAPSAPERFEAPPAPAEPEPTPIPELPATEPAFDIPSSPPPEAKVVEEVSTWRKVWQPFLYESIGWFIGAFLVVAGSVYFVALGWSGMSHVGRALTIFGLAAGYSAAFSVTGALLLRREPLAGAGRVVALIGSAMAPFAPLALSPVELAAPWAFWALAALWAAAAAWLAGGPSRAYDPASSRAVRFGMGASILAVSAAPTLAHGLGSGAVWLGGSAFALLAAVRRRPERTAEQASFALLAPIYLGAIFAIRLHGTLADVAAAPPLPTYAPFLSALVALALWTWPHRGELSTPLAVGAVSVQVLAVAAAAVGLPPAFFAASAVLAATSAWLSRSARGGERWLYPAYAAGYLAYQSAGQLLSPPVRSALMAALRDVLSSGAPLPFNWAAIYALPYVLGGTLLALRLRRSGGERRSEAVLRATAAATLFFCLEALCGPDPRPMAWSIPVLAANAVALGLALDRPYLSWSGWGGALAFPLAVGLALHAPPAPLWAAAIALAFAALSRLAARPHQLAPGAVLHTIAVAAIALSQAGAGPAARWGAAAVALAAAAAWIASGRIEREEAKAWALLLSVSVAPYAAFVFWPGHEALALAAAALCAALVRSRSAPFITLAAAAIAGVAQLSAYWSSDPRLAAPVLLLGAAAALVASRRAPWVAIFGALCWAALLLTPLGGHPPYPWLTPAVSTWAFAATAAGASAWTVWRGRSPGTIAFAIAAAAGGFLVAGAVSFDAGETPLLLAAALGTLLASRALRADVCLPIATLVALLQLLLATELAGMELLAAGLSALAFLERWPKARDLLLGRHRAGIAAAACSFFVLATVAVRSGGSEIATAEISVLPFAWVLATGAPAFAGAALLLGALGARADHAGSSLWAIAATVAFSRFAWHAPVAAAAMVGRQGWSARLPRWVSFGFAAAIAVLLARAYLGHPSAFSFPVEFMALAVGALAAAGSALAPRIALFALAGAFESPYRGAFAIAAAALGFWILHGRETARASLAAPESPDLEKAPGYSAWAAMALGLLAAFDAPRFGAWALMPAASLAAAALLLRDRRLLAVSAVALGAALGFGHRALGLRWDDSFGIAVSAALTSGAILAWRLTSVGKWIDSAISRASPGIQAGADAPIWVGAAIQLLGWVLLRGGPLISDGIGVPTWRECAVALAAGALLWSAASWLEVGAAAALWGSALLVCLPAGWGAAAVAGSGLALAVWARLRSGAISEALHHAGWILGIAALPFIGGLGHPALPVTLSIDVALAWLVVARRPSLELAGWGATAAAAQLAVMHLGEVLATGAPPELALPHLSAAAALVSSIAALLPANPRRRWAALALGAAALAEAVLGLSLAVRGGPREAAVAGAGLALLCAAMVAMARRDSDERPAAIALGALLLGYLAVRLHGMGGGLGASDGLAALVGGAVFSGLHVWIRHSADLSPAFRRPALAAAYAFPLIGLLAAPWDHPLVTAALLVGYAAHFGVLASAGQRRLASVASAAAFNAALALAWVGTRAGEAEYYLIPFGLSLLVLIRIFRQEISPGWQARLRGVAITTVYVASAYRALLFTDAWALGVCALACVVGVAAGIALRIRSFVYLGTGFLVASVAANLVRTGVREPHLGALFLSALGLLVVGFMVLFTARRAELLRRYEQMRAFMADWEG